MQRIELGWFIPTQGDTTAYGNPKADIPASLAMFDRVTQAAENAGFDGDPPPLAAYPRARCSADACVADLGASGRTLLALRSTQRLDWAELTRACAAADIVVADRRLPRACKARWLTLDAPQLRASGGLVIHAEQGRADSVAGWLKRLPWAGGT